MPTGATQGCLTVKLLLRVAQTGPYSRSALRPRMCWCHILWPKSTWMKYLNSRKREIIEPCSWLMSFNFPAGVMSNCMETVPTSEPGVVIHAAGASLAATQRWCCGGCAACASACTTPRRALLLPPPPWPTRQPTSGTCWVGAPGADENLSAWLLKSLRRCIMLCHFVLLSQPESPSLLALKEIWSPSCPGLVAVSTLNFLPRTCKIPRLMSSKLH